MAIGLLILVAVVALALLPQMWVKSVLARHAHERPEFPGTGGELAEHLIGRLRLDGVRVEETTLGDHYDPLTKTVRLLPAHMHGRSLAAVVVAAHEVGHAVQDATGYAPLATRTRLARHAQKLETAGAIVMLAAPIVLALARVPHVLLLEVALGFLILSMSILMHLVTLPVELDASFNRALPLLEKGQFLEAGDMPAAREILRAAAFTYVASAALSLLDVMRWLRLLRV